jgi:hypothetical protein
MWLTNFILTLRVVDNMGKQLMIYCDNKIIIFFSHNNKLSGAAKHIDLRYFIVRERVQNHTINLEHICTKKIHADALTKGLPHNIFEEHVDTHGFIGKPLIMDRPNKETNSYYE